MVQIVQRPKRQPSGTLPVQDTKSERENKDSKAGRIIRIDQELLSNKLNTRAGEVNVKVSQIAHLDFQDSDYRARPKAGELVEEALMERCPAGISARRVEDITEAFWGTRVRPATVSNLDKKVYNRIEKWINAPIGDERSTAWMK